MQSILPTRLTDQQSITDLLTHLKHGIGSNLHDFYNLYKMILFDRASIEPNFHDLYLKFLDKVNSKALNKEIVQATYENCKV